MIKNKIKYVAAAVLFASASSAFAFSLSGTIYDKKIADPDFEDPCCSGVVTGLVSSTLSGSGLPTFVGAPGAGDITSAASFDSWWTDTHGSTAFGITLAETGVGTGIYTYSDSSFFPIDGMLAGNEGNPHNYHFTMHLSGTTTFLSTDSFTFTGDDDLWVYIGDKLVMDLGGVHGAASSTITGADLISAGLTAGTAYDLDVFFAERHTVASNFNITTSFHVESTKVPEPESLVLVGLGLIGVAVSKRRKLV